MKKDLSIFILFAFTLIFIAGCSDKEEEGLAYISTNEDSEYMRTFKELGIGVLYDFDFKLPHADKSWVTIWVEGYRNGEKVRPFHLTELSYGQSPNKIDKGHLGFGIINPHNKNPLFLLYAPGVGSQPQMIESNILNSKGASMWDYAIGDEQIELESEETKILGVYRQAENSFRTYDAQDADSVEQMIKEDDTVLLLKIKVEEKDENDL